jgi:hypothetical protein
MTKEKKVTIKMPVRSAAAVRQVLFDAQKGYTTGPSCPERVNEIREVITNLDDAITTVVESD